MLGETAAITISAIFSSLGLIYFLYFYLMKISGLEVESAIRHSKHAELFEADSNIRASLLNKEEKYAGNEAFRTNFAHILQQTQSFLQEMFKSQAVLAFVCAIFFALVVIFLLDECLGCFYATFAYIWGILFALLMHDFAAKFGQSGIALLIFQSVENDYAHDTFQLAYSLGLALIIGFVSLLNLVLIILTTIFRAMYVSDDQRFDEYGKMFTFMCGGFTLAYCFVAFFFRVSGALYQASVATTADLVAKSDEEIPTDNFFNPCSIPDQIATFYKNFMANFSDITSVILLTVSGICILTCHSQEFTQEKATFYFSALYLSFTVLMALISALLLNFSLFNPSDIGYCSKTYRVQQFLSHLFSLSFNIFLPLVVYVDDFSVLFLDDVALAGKVPNIQQPSVSRGWMVLCLFMGYLAEILLLNSSEILTSHAFRPVRSLLDKSENGPCVNVFVSAILVLLGSAIPFFSFFLCFFVCYGVLGFFGLALCGLGFVANFIPCFCVNTAGALAENALKVAKIAGVLRDEEFRRSPLFVIQWTAQNLAINVRICCFAGFFFGSFAALGCVVGNLEGKTDLLSLKTLQITGLLFGSFFPALLSGVLLAAVQKILQNLVLLAKKQFSLFPGIKKGVEKPEFQQIFEKARDSALVFAFVIFVFNFMVVYFYGLFFGVEGVFGLLLGMTLCSSYFVFSAYMNGAALTNSKNFAENNNSVEEFGPIAASVSVGEMFSLLTKESVPSLMIINFLNLLIYLLGMRIFAQTGWISSDCGLN